MCDCYIAIYIKEISISVVDPGLMKGSFRICPFAGCYNHFWGGKSQKNRDRQDFLR